MSKTIDDLKAAFAGESQANRKYLAFAKKADAEGFPQVAKLFRAVAAAETVHALSHLRVLGEVKSTQENLKAAMDGEHYEVTSMYPEFIVDAEKEGDKKALNSFNNAIEAEKIHEQMYARAIEDLGKPGDDEDYYVCPVCGFTHKGKYEAERCPVCATPSARFERIS